MGRGGTGAEQDPSLQTCTRTRPPPRRSAAQPAGAPAAVVDETLSPVPSLVPARQPLVRALPPARRGRAPQARAKELPRGPVRPGPVRGAVPRLPQPGDRAGRVRGAPICGSNLGFFSAANRPRLGAQIL